MPLTTDDNKEQKPDVTFAPEPVVEGGKGVKQESDVKGKIPEGAEATTVLVGTLDELEEVGRGNVKGLTLDPKA